MQLCGHRDKIAKCLKIPKLMSPGNYMHLKLTTISCSHGFYSFAFSRNSKSKNFVVVMTINKEFFSFAKGHKNESNQSSPYQTENHKNPVKNQLDSQIWSQFSSWLRWSSLRLSRFSRSESFRGWVDRGLSKLVETGSIECPVGLNEAYRS